MSSTGGKSSPKYLLLLLLCSTSMVALLLCGQSGNQTKMFHFWRQEEITCQIPSMEQVSQCREE